MLFRVEHRLDSPNTAEHTVTTYRQRSFNLVKSLKLIHLRGRPAYQSKHPNPGRGQKTFVVMDPLHYQYVYRVQQLWDERRPPKRHPTDYYLEQQELARPWVGPVPEWALHHDDLPPTYPLFQRYVLAAWAFIVTIANTVAEPLRHLAVFLWRCARIFVFWTVVLPVKVTYSIVRSLQLELVVAALAALLIARWLPGMAGEEAKEPRPTDDPVYVLMIRGGERLSKPMVVSYSPIFLPDSFRNRSSLSTSELNHRQGNNSLIACFARG
jgi:hypothetical protein